MIQTSRFRHLFDGTRVRDPKAVHQLDLLLFDWWPEINLDLRDDMSNRRPGYCFLSDPANHLQRGLRLLSQRAFSRRHGGMSWTVSCQPRLLRYLHDCDRFVQLLFAAIHMTSGMPARGEEVRVIRWANTPTVSRNIVCFQKKLLLIFPYNKACTNTNNAFYIVRTPSPAVGGGRDCLPRLRSAVSRHAGSRIACVVYGARVESASVHPAQRGNGVFQAEGLSSKPTSSDISSAACAARMRMYRQIAVAMSKKHIPSLLKPFNAHAPYSLGRVSSATGFSDWAQTLNTCRILRTGNGIPLKNCSRS